MSSGPAVTMTEGNVESISNSQMTSGGPVKEHEIVEGNSCLGTKHKFVTTENNHATEERSIMKHSDASCVSRNGPNHALWLDKIESFQKPTADPSARKAQFVIEAKTPVPTKIDASGDGFPQSDKTSSMTDQTSAPLANRKGVNDITNYGMNSSEEKAKFAHDGASVKSSLMSLKIPNVESERNAKSQENDADCSKITKVQDSTLVTVNEDLDGISCSTSSVASTEPAGSANAKAQKAYKAIRHTGSDVQILSKTEDGSSTSGDVDASQGSKLNCGPPRREPEKPPRMQKQGSRDRLVQKQQQKSGFNPDPRRQGLSKKSSFECVDSTGLPVHVFLKKTLQESQRCRVILLQIEKDLIDFLNNDTIEFIKFPPMTRFHRMLVHKTAAYFEMDHNVDETGDCVIINKRSTSRMPDERFSDMYDLQQLPDQQSGNRDDDMRRSILRRSNQSRSFDREDANASSATICGRRGISSMAATRMSSWSNRPWNSTEMNSSMRMQGQRPLATRASSYSCILAGHNNSAMGRKTGSSSSVSSTNSAGMKNVVPRGRPQPQNVGQRPPTPVRRNGKGDNGSGAYYYMHNPNQDLPFDAVEDDIAQLWFPESPESFGQCDSDFVVPANTPILLAVPYGMTLPPETVLCHPITGMPYLNSEGYRLVYQNLPGSAGTGSMSFPPQFPSYYQTSPQPPHHPGIGAYPRRHSPYEESAHKSQQRFDSSDPAMMSAIPAYPPSIPTTVYSGVQGQPPPPSLVASNLPLPGMQALSQHQVQSMSMMPPSDQGFVPQQPSLPGTPVYPPYVLAQPVDPAMPQSVAGREGLTGGAMMAKPVPAAQPLPPGYPSQQTVFSPTAANQAPLNSNGYNQCGRNEPSDSSNRMQDGAKTTEEKLNDKMQELALGNYQQHGQVPQHAATCEPANTVTAASLSPSIYVVQNARQTPVVEGHDPMSTAMHHRLSSEALGGYQHQYTCGNGSPHAQQPQMQLYVMPNNSAVNTNASYGAYSQFITHAQTPHVLGPGMQLVYLNSPVAGVDGRGVAIATPPNILHHGQVSHPVRQPLEGSPAFVSNANNNNNAAGKSMFERSRAADIYNTGVQPTVLRASVLAASGQVATGAIQASAETFNHMATPDFRNELEKATSEVTRSTTASCNVRTFENHTAQYSTAEVNHVFTPIATPPSNNSNTHHIHNHPPAPSPMILSNVPQPYAAGPASYSPVVTQHHPVYPGMGPTQYIYLPSIARSQKLPDMKVYHPAQAAQPYAEGMATIQCQNQIQFVPAASQHHHHHHHQNPIYYAPYSYAVTGQRQVAATGASMSTRRASASEQAQQSSVILQAVDPLTPENATGQQGNSPGAVVQAEIVEDREVESQPEEEKSEVANASTTEKQ